MNHAKNQLNKSTVVLTQQNASRPLRHLVFAFAPLLAFMPAQLLAQENTSCDVSGQNASCTTSSECKGNRHASVCIDGTCQIPCDDSQGEPVPTACLWGESCVPGIEPGVGPRLFCKTSRFRMDLNLLDACVYHFIAGTLPDLSGTNSCSLAARLGKMLDQDSNGIFNILDVDLCVRSFLQEEACDPSTETCPDDQVYCEADSDCGAGLYCDPDLYMCTRECGFVQNRAASTDSSETLERKCMGQLAVCDHSYGKCKTTVLYGGSCSQPSDCDPSENCIGGMCQQAATCQLDKDCPYGAYCFVGLCQPKCYRAIDCPDSNWYCGIDNRCRPVPKEAGTGESFEPKDYSVQFAKKKITMDPIQNEYDIPLVVMNRNTMRQVFSDPNILFGYRLEAAYGLKNGPKCQGNISELPPEDQADCIISSDEEFVTIENPFGTVYADGDTILPISINEGAAALLDPGHYQATLTAIFNNGSTSAVTVEYHKPSINGDYFGRLSIYRDSPGNLLGSGNISMKLYVAEDQPTKEWDALLDENHIYQDREFIDVTRGYEVSGYISGTESLIFNWPDALSDAENKIPVTGLYSPSMGRMRLIGIIDVDANHCRSQSGECTGNNDYLEVSNPFGRSIRRIVEFMGPFHDTERRFDGMYRETLTGLTPDAVTLEGGFSIRQVTQKDAAIEIAPLLSPEGGQAIVFPRADEILALVNADIEESCSGHAEEVGYFNDRESFQDYLGGGVGQILTDVVSLEDEVGNALKSLSASGEPDAGGPDLTFRDYLKSRLGICPEDGESGGDDGSQGVSCVDEQALRCGLSLFRKAIIGGPTGGGGDSQWINVQAVERTKVNAAAFRDGTPANPATEPTLFTLHEHNRFHKDLFQALVFTAGEGLSDAFYLLYKASLAGNAIGEASAFDLKGRNLQRAVAYYNAAVEELVASQAAKVLFAWPAQKFNDEGRFWLKHMHTVLSDRLDALVEYFDLRRRVLNIAGSNDFLFVHHVMHYEYLQQAYLMALEKDWHGEEFDWGGKSDWIFEKGDLLLAKTSESRNALGLPRNRVFFENSNLALANWQNYRYRLTGSADGSVLNAPGGGIAAMSETIDTAVSALQGSLRDEDNLKNSLRDTRQHLEMQLQELCGPLDAPVPEECDLEDEARRQAAACSGDDCLYEYTCESPECEQVAQTFAEDGMASHVACRSDTRSYTVVEGGVEQQCVRGRMGDLMQERVTLDLQRKHVVRKTKALMRQLDRQRQHIAETQTANTDLINFLDKKNGEINAAAADMAKADFIYDKAEAAAKGADCWVLVGLSGGSNCLATAAKAITTVGLLDTRYAVQSHLKESVAEARQAKEIALQEAGAERQIREMRMLIDNLTTEVENYIAEYEAISQQLFNLNIRIKDTHFAAQSAIDRYRETTSDLFESLVGLDTGSIFLRNRMVAESNLQFHRLLLDAYKMTQAFIHRFNIGELGHTSLACFTPACLRQKVLHAVTLDDVKDIVTHVSLLERDYCGATPGLDCDFMANGDILRFSLREQLFPELQDIADPGTADTLTAGEQFHRIITSSDYVRRGVDPVTGMNSRIEIPFAIWANDRGTAGRSPQRFLPSLENDCNHIIRGNGQEGGGTMAVQFLGSHLTQNVIRAQVVRGDTDYIRSCDDPEELQTYIVGQPVLEPTAALFGTSTGVQSMCSGDVHLSGNNPSDWNKSNCFFYFARDRSLAAPDWRIVIPNLETSQSWLLGEGVEKDKEPVISDIVIFIRYNDRPLGTN